MRQTVMVAAPPEYPGNDRCVGALMNQYETGTELYSPSDIGKVIP